MSVPEKMKRTGEALWEIPTSYKAGMRVPARIYATERLLTDMDEGVIEQITNVATLPGILDYAFCMPDGHWGYGFPIGGAAAFDLEQGVISPGGIGFDINCGMRLVKTDLQFDEVKQHLHTLIDRLFQRIPAGVGCRGTLQISRDDFRNLIEQGAAWCLKAGYGLPGDLRRTEEGGCMRGADSTKVSETSIERGYRQVGTLGSGNHYLEIQVLKPENIFDHELAGSFGINIPNQVMIMFHCGSRGFGHQVATDYVKLFLERMNSRYKLDVKDRELACAPFRSQDGQDYFAAMKCAVNMAYANRQVILHRIREVFSDVFHRSPEDLGMEQIYDVAHNTAKLERHMLHGNEREVLIHRKGATRALGPGGFDLPPEYSTTGQPVIIGGSMETGSYLLVGTDRGRETFFTTAHGSGRQMSRRSAKKRFDGRKLQRELLHRGIYVRTSSFAGLAEEAGAAYKNIDEVVDATLRAGISRSVARFLPVGNIKG
ncbi:MAG: RtcB family protein [Spirochaetes bacterium]|nr:RtcB family protein [Spirochaetota bacterium]